MKKRIFLALSLTLLAVGAYAANPQQPGVATSTGAMFAISATTNPSLIESTGTNVKYDYNQGQAYVPPTFSSNVARGTFMAPRLWQEIFNDTGLNIYVGYNSNVTTQAASGNGNYGRKIPHGGAMAYDDCLPKWIVSESSTTERKIIITQGN